MNLFTFNQSEIFHFKYTLAFLWIIALDFFWQFDSTSLGFKLFIDHISSSTTMVHHHHSWFTVKPNVSVFLNLLAGFTLACQQFDLLKSSCQ